MVSSPSLGCAPDHGDGPDELPNCDRDEPVALLAAAPDEVITWQRVPQGFLVEVRVPFSRARTSVVDACGEHEQELDPWSPADGNAASFEFAAPWTLRCGEAGRVDVYEIGDVISSHRLFERTPGCRMHAFHGGLAAVDPKTHELVFVADPSDARETPRVLARDVVAEGSGWCGRGDFPHCDPVPIDVVRTIGFEDHILAPQIGDKLQDELFGHAISRVDLEGSVVLADAMSPRVRSMAIFADGRYAVLGGHLPAAPGTNPTGVTWIYDSHTRRFTSFGTSSDFRVVGPWIVDQGPRTAPQELDLMQPATGTRHHVDTADAWVLPAATDMTLFLSVEEPVRQTPARVRGYVDDLRDGTLRPLFVLDDSLHANLSIAPDAKLVFVHESRELIDWTGGPAITTTQVAAAEFRRTETMTALAFEPDRRLRSPVVFFDRTAHAAWELTADGGVEIVDSRDDGGIVILYADAGTLWRRDL